MTLNATSAQLWLSARLDAAGNVQLAAESDAILPRGFAAVLVHALSGTRPEALLGADLVALFGDLCPHAASLTPSRTNGFLNILEAVHERVRMLAVALPSCPSLPISHDGVAPQVRSHSCIPVPTVCLQPFSNAGPNRISTGCFEACVESLIPCCPRCAAVCAGSWTHP